MTETIKGLYLDVDWTEQFLRDNLEPKRFILNGVETRVSMDEVMETFRKAVLTARLEERKRIIALIYGLGNV